MVSEEAEKHRRVKSALLVARRYPAELSHMEQVSRLAAMLFDAFLPLHNMGTSERELLLCAALLHDIGISKGFAGHHKTSRRMILAADLAGLTAAERAIVAEVARYHRKAEPCEEHESFCSLKPKEQDVVRRLAAILRVADGLDRAHKNAVCEVHAAPGPSKGAWTVWVDGKGDLAYAIQGAERKAGMFESVYDVRLLFEFAGRSCKGAKR